jgi:hypothetical protein
MRWLNMAQYWFNRADAHEQTQALDAERRDNDRIKSFHHV